MEDGGGAIAGGGTNSGADGERIGSMGEAGRRPSARERTGSGAKEKNGKSYTSGSTGLDVRVMTMMFCSVRIDNNLR